MLLTVADSEGQARVVTLLEESVRDELRLSVGIEQLGLSDAQVETLAPAVTSQVLYAFDIGWSPDGVAPGDVDARCPRQMPLQSRRPRRLPHLAGFDLLADHGSHSPGSQGRRR